MRRKLDLRDTSDIDELTVMEGISGRAILQNCPLIKDGSRFHSEGLEEPLSQKISIPPPAGLLDDHTEQEIPDVAVSPAISGTEVQRIFGRRLKQLSGGIVRPDATFPQSFETILQPGQSRCVSEEMAHGDVFPLTRGIGEIMRNGIVQSDFALFHQEHNGCRGKLFGDRSQLKYGVRCDRYIMFEVGHPITLQLNDLAILYHNQG